MAFPEHELDNPKIKALLNALGDSIRADLPDGWGFTLFLFSYGDGGELFYLSSAQRSGMLNVVREWLQKAGVN